ncbi:MAG TPA: ABC transporter permease [Candidatus Dormibacteraeota bacterium]|nr:ABC transporter permease [Candidatus Dormibacteraeota bacterium]
MTAVLVKAFKDLRQRRLQAAVIFLTGLLAVGTGTMALTLMSQTKDPYQAAFEAQKGAHLQVTYSAQTDVQALEATPALLGAATSGGPYPASTVELQLGTRKVFLDTFGRSAAGGDIEQLRITSGRWPVGNDEIVLTRSFAELNNVSVGQRLKVVSVPQEPVLTVAALVVDIDEGSADLSSQHAWMLPSAIPAVSARGWSFYLMTYRFADDPTSSQLSAYMDRLRTSLPPGSITGSVNYLLIRNIFNITNQIVTSVLLAFSIFALAATAAIVANLVTGIVISSYREIGIMKAVGFTPMQVVAVFVLQVLIPAAAASVIAIPAGALLSQPLLSNSSHALGLAYQPTFSIALDLLALAGALFIVALAALVPALRAGLLKPAVVIANATAPRGMSGRNLRRLAARLRLPRPVVLGFGDAFARPLRSVLTLLALFLGLATVTVALGLPRSFLAINNSETGAGKVQVVVRPSPALSDASVMGVIGAQPQTQNVVAEAGQNVIVPGITDPVNSRLFRGDSSRLGYLLVSGRWFSGPGEVLAPKALLQDAHLKVGDPLPATIQGHALRLVVVGEIYDINNLGQSLFMDWSSAGSAVPDLAPDEYLITLKPGSDVDAYMKRVAAAEPDLLDVQRNNTDIIGPVKIIDNVLVIIAVVIAVIGIAGVFNTLLLNARERIRDTAALKAIGMSPRQVVVMVAASAGLLALIGGIVATPAGLGLHHVLLDLISNSAGNDTPPSTYNVFGPLELVAIPLLGVGVAVAAAVVPGRWAARTSVVEVLHSE